MSNTATAPRRHKGFQETHQLLIDVAVRLISERGVDALSLSALARAAEVNRTTVYYHFADRDALVAAVKHWSSEQIVQAFRHDLPRVQRMEHVTRFVLANPELMGLWIEDFISPGDIRTSYSHWDALVAGIREHFTHIAPDDEVDAEIYCVQLLTSAFIGPRVFRNRVNGKASDAEVVRRFRQEQQRVLRRDGLVEADG